MAQEPQVKGVWFVTARRLVLRDHGEDTLQAIARAMSKPEVLLEPMPSTWYHEDHFQDALHVHMLVLARQDTR
ncbi:MAG TPA: hypothetical protein VIY73_25835, partial [Polyangiaceae bacterium]